MDILKHFEYNPIIDLTAAQIGINKWYWETIDSEDEDMAKAMMKEKRYDVLPIKELNGKVNKSFTTRNWNQYENLNLTKIDSSNSIYYRLSFIELIKKFKTEKTHFYFLINNNEVLGLVSYVNINCQAVYTYLYQVIADMEQSIANLLKEHINQNDILALFENSEDKHIHEVLYTFNTTISEGSDNSIFEHMYLQTVGITLGKFYNKLPEQYRILNKYTRKFSANGIYNLLRNKVMHPVCPILNDSESISEIDCLLTDYLEIKEILRKK